MGNDERGATTSAGLLLLSAVFGPPLIAVLFGTFFQWISRTFAPQGNLSGRDLSLYAYLDLALFIPFGAALIAFVILGARRARSVRTEIIFIVLASVVSFIAFFGTFFGMMAR